MQMKKRTKTFKENWVYLQKKAMLFGELYFYIYNSHETLPKSHYRTSLGEVLYILAFSVDDWATALCIVVEMAGITFS